MISISNQNSKTGKWPAGIPDYDESDILRGQELHEFAMNVVKQSELDKNGYQIIAASKQLDKIPNFVCKKDRETIFIIVKASVAPNFPELTIADRINVIRHASKYGAKCFFAPVGIGACDAHRFEQGLALKNDAFYVRYDGLQPI